jgi:hypothetical protein
VSSARSLCDGPIARPEEPLPIVVFLIECDREISYRRPRPTWAVEPFGGRGGEGGRIDQY